MRRPHAHSNAAPPPCVEPREVDARPCLTGGRTRGGTLAERAPRADDRLLGPRDGPTAFLPRVADVDDRARRCARDRARARARRAGCPRLVG
eukprot:3629316-Prymnesium_polylepis.1